MNVDRLKMVKKHIAKYLMAKFRSLSIAEGYDELVHEVVRLGGQEGHQGRAKEEGHRGAHLHKTCHQARSEDFKRGGARFQMLSCSRKF